MNQKLILIIILIGGIVGGVIIAPYALDWYINYTYPTYDNNILSGQYIVHGIYIDHNTIKVNNTEIHLQHLNERPGYKICPHNKGDEIIYFIFIDVNEFETIDYYMMREMC